MPQLPDCFCDQEAMADCHWVLEVDIRYHNENPNIEDAPESHVSWKLQSIPQPLAQVILQAMVKACNEQGFDVYKEWMQACGGEAGDMSAMVQQMSAMVK